MRKLAYKVMIDAIEPMDADTLECAVVKGWRVVVRKGEFKPGDVALYFEIDSALSPHDDRYAFLKERCYKKFMLHGKLWDECLRIRSMKLRGVISQGLLLPTEQFCEIRNMKVGEDCTALLAVRHYDDMAERVLQLTGSVKPADQKGPFPSFIPKTDEERCVAGDTEIVVDGVKQPIQQFVERFHNKTAEQAHCVKACDTATQTAVDAVVEGVLVTTAASEDEWYEVTTESGNRLNITGNSLMWLPEEAVYRRVDSLKEGDKLLITE